MAEEQNVARTSLVPSVGPLVPGVRPILSEADGVVVGELGRVCVAIWRGAATPERFEDQRAGLAEVVRNHPDGAGFLCVIEPTSAPPSDRLRRASIEMITVHKDRLKCVAVVIEGEGFRAATVRGVISGMRLIFPHGKPPASAFSKVGESVGWMQQHVRIVMPELVIRGVEELRSLLDRTDENG
jgi:hypothetical protein